MMMNIALAANEKFAIPCLVTIISILENNKHNDCSIYVLTTGFAKKTAYKFHKLREVYHQKIEIIVLGTEQLKGVTIDPVFSIMTYFRFFLPELLIKESKVLYLDSDIIVRGSLNELYNTNVSDKACAVVEDQWADDIRAKNRLKTDAPTFNAGMLVMNLEYWRKHNISKTCIEYLIQNKDTCIFFDQDAMNSVLENQVQYLPYRFNVQAGWLSNLNELPFHRSKWDYLHSEIENAIIMHYSMVVKPWHKESTHPYTNEFLHYASIHPFINLSIKSCYSIQYRLINWLLSIYNKITKKKISIR